MSGSQYRPLAQQLYQMCSLAARRASGAAASCSSSNSAGGTGGGGATSRAAGLALQSMGKAGATLQQQRLWQGSLAAMGAARAMSTSAAAATAGRAARAPSLLRSARAMLHNYKQLSKAKLSALVVLTASGGFVAGSGEAIDWAGLVWTSLGTFGAAACANALNQLYEVANDRRMVRTCNRPLPAGRMSRPHALAFAVLAGGAGLWLLHEKVNPTTAGLGAANILLYAGIYTPLKQLSVVNTWVGAVVGAIPPLMGWAGAAGYLEPGAWVLASALFFWQMPHFLSLAWLCKDDYIRGGFRMLSMLDRTGRRTAGAALRHCAYLLPVGAAAVVMGVASPWFAAESAALTAVMGYGAISFYKAPSNSSARKLFRGSLLFLPLLLLGLAVHRQPNTHTLQDMAAVRRQIEQDYGVTLPRMPQIKLRSLEERLGPALPALVSIKCPSRAYSDSVQTAEQQAMAARGVVVDGDSMDDEREPSDADGSSR